MHNNKHYPLLKVSMTTLALLVTPLTQAQDKAAEASQGTQEELNVDAADQQKQGTTKTTNEASTGKSVGPQSANRPRRWYLLRPSGIAFTGSSTRRNTAR